MLIREGRRNAWKDLKEAARPGDNYKRCLPLVLALPLGASTSSSSSPSSS
jgi:hypothetical protein